MLLDAGGIRGPRAAFPRMLHRGAADVRFFRGKREKGAAFGRKVLKAFRADGSANLSDIVRAIYYAVDNGAKVINMSFSSMSPSASLSAAIRYAASNRVICIASAGNEGKRVMVYPAGIGGVIGVGSTNLLDQRSIFSNHGEASVDMAAPGEALVTTYPGSRYAGVWGTSFSTALVSGTAALLAQIHPQISPHDVSEAFEHGYNLPGDTVGEARLDIYASILFYLLDR